MWSMPLMPYMSPAAIGWIVVRLRGWPVRGEALADRGQHRVGAAEAAGRADGDDGAVGDQRRRIGRGEDCDAGHRLSLPVSTGTARPLAAASRTASAVASDQTPSSPVAAGWPSPRTAAWNRRTARS